MRRSVHLSNTRISRQGGFTLLEVLLAFMVFALSFTVVLEIMTGSMRNTVRAREYTEVSLIAQSLMDQLGLDIPLMAGTSQNGQSGAYEWDMEIYTYNDSVGDALSVQLGELTGIELLQVDLVISWGEPPRERSNSFNTVRAMMANRVENGR